MGIYRTLLEEEVPHLDDNNNPDEQIKELQDVIEDQDANQAEQDAAQDAAYGPDCGVDDIMDESAYAIYEFECGHAQIMQAIGMHELQEAAAGREFIFEAADIKGFFKSVKDKIVAFFKKVWSVLQRWAGNLTAVFASNKKFAEKYATQMRTGYNICNSSKYSGKKLKGYKFPTLDDDIKEAKAQKDAKIPEDVKKKIDELKAKLDHVGKYTKYESQISAEDVEAFLNKVRGSACGEESVSASEFSSKLKKAIYGGEEPTEFWMTVDEVVKILSGKKDDAKAVNEFMKNAKKQSKEAIDLINGLEKAVSKVEDGQFRTGAMADCSRAITMERGSLTILQTWRSATLSAINARARQARRYGMAYVAAANRDKHKGFQKESAEYGFLGNLGLV